MRSAVARRVPLSRTSPIKPRLVVAATGLLCAAIMTDHWEEIYWDKAALEKANVSPSWFLDGKVGRLEGLAGRPAQRGHHAGQAKPRLGPAFLVPMHGGIWTLCVSLTGKWPRVRLRPCGFG